MGKLKFIPNNELQTREWFAAHIADYEYNIVVSQTAFPDYVLSDNRGNKFLVEVEFTSSNFVKHGHKSSECDFVLCWQHDAQIPIKVWELETNTIYPADAEPRPEVKADILPRSPKRILADSIVDALPVCAKEKNEFLAAMASDLRRRSEWVDIVGKARTQLLLATSSLIKALKKNGANVDDLHPDDLLALISMHT